jgi:hypothetical protein
MYSPAVVNEGNLLPGPTSKISKVTPDGFFETELCNFAEDSSASAPAKKLCFAQLPAAPKAIADKTFRLVKYVNFKVTLV